MAGEITLKELSPQLREYIENAQGSGSIYMNVKYDSVTATEENQTVFQIPIEDYIQESCHLDIKINSTWIAPHLYTITDKTITLVSGVVKGTVVHFTVYLLGVSAVEALDASKIIESDAKQFISKEQKDKIGILSEDRGYLTTKKITDCNLAIRNGTYYIHNGLNMPKEKGGFTVTVINFDNTWEYKQIASESRESSVYIRSGTMGFGTDTTWRPWEKLPDRSDIDSLSEKVNPKETFITSEDWDTITEQGHYGVNKATGANKPNTHDYGELIVSHGKNSITQIFYPNVGDRGKTHRTKWGSNAWTKWVYEATTEQLSTNEDIVIVKVSEPSLEQYNSLSDNMPNATYYKRLFQNAVAIPELGGGNWYVEGVKSNNLYEWQFARTYNLDGGIKFRAKNNGTWSKFIDIATTNKTEIPFPFNTDYGNPTNTDYQFRVIRNDSLKTVRLHIVVRKLDNSVPPATGVAIGVLPVGFRPKVHTSGILMNDISNNVEINSGIGVRVYSNGQVNIIWNGKTSVAYGTLEFDCA